MQCEVCIQFMKLKSWYHKIMRKNKTNLKTIFLVQQKKQVKCANKHTNITNKQTTNKACTLKNI